MNERCGGIFSWEQEAQRWQKQVKSKNTITCDLIENRFSYYRLRSKAMVTLEGKPVMGSTDDG